jgi:hypothetical protein
VRRIVKQIDDLHPDLILSAGDFTGQSLPGAAYPLAEAVAPLAALRAPRGVFAVLGNNDDKPREYLLALHAAGIRVLMNESVRVGPLVLSGLDGRLAHSQPALDEARERTYREASSLHGVAILIAHRPDEFVSAPPSMQLVLSGHTHCGQVVLPVIGPLITGSDYGARFLCGVHRDGRKLLVVTAGLGTSHLPIRIGAPPDLWLISIESR